jgi:hypothetical protein
MIYNSPKGLDSSFRQDDTKCRFLIFYEGINHCKSKIANPKLKIL